MSGSEHDPSRRSRRHRDAGPQGTQVFSREEVGELLQSAQTRSQSRGGAALRGASESVSGQSFVLSGTTMVVGRSPDCGIRLDQSSVSAEHARLVRDEAGWRVVNLLSTNGTFVNGRKVSNASLDDGDRVSFGAVEFLFHDPEGRRDPSADGGAGRAVRSAALAVLAVGVAGLLVWLLR